MVGVAGKQRARASDSIEFSLFVFCTICCSLAGSIEVPVLHLRTLWYAMYKCFYKLCAKRGHLPALVVVVLGVAVAALLSSAVVLGWGILVAAVVLILILNWNLYRSKDIE